MSSIHDLPKDWPCSSVATASCETQVHFSEPASEKYIDIGTCESSSTPARFRELVRELEAEFDRLLLENMWFSNILDQPKGSGDSCREDSALAFNRQKMMPYLRPMQEKGRSKPESPHLALRPHKEPLRTRPPCGDVILEREVTDDVKASTDSMVVSSNSQKSMQLVSDTLSWQAIPNRARYSSAHSWARNGASVVLESIEEDGNVGRFRRLKEQFNRLDSLAQGKLSATFCHGMCNHLPLPPTLKSVAEAIHVVRTARGETGLASSATASFANARASGKLGSFNPLNFHQPIAIPPLSMAEVSATYLEFDDFTFLMEGLHEVTPFSNDTKRVLGMLRKVFKEEHHHHVLKETHAHLQLREKDREEPMLHGTGGVLLDTLPPIVIFLNSISLGLSAEIDAPNFWEVLEYVFTGFYLFEFIFKVWCYGCRVYFLGRQKYWNWFDFFCLSLALGDLITTIFIKSMGGTGVDLNGFMMLKILRLARIARLVRALHFGFFKELKAMVIGVVSGLRVLGWAIVLLMTCIYAISVALNRIMGHEEPEFDSVSSSMFTVFRCFTDGCVADDGTPLHERLRRKWGALFFVGYILLFMFVTVGVFNLIMAVFIDNVVSSSIHRKQQELNANANRMEYRIKVVLKGLLGRERARFMKPKLKHAGSALVEEMCDLAGVLRRDLGLSKDDFNGVSTDRELAAIAAGTTVTSDIFEMWLHDPDFLQMLEDCDIESSNKGDLFDVLDVDMGGELTVSELVGGLMRLRGPITKSDIVAVRLKTSYVTSMVEDMWRIIVNREKPHTYASGELDF